MAKQGITWQEFKAVVEARGVRDTDIVDYIDVQGVLKPDDLVVNTEDRPHLQHRAFTVLS